MVEILVFC